MNIKKPTMNADPGADQALGGAPIADRFKLDMTAPSASKATPGKGTTFAVIAGLLALAVSGVLTFIIYQHWQFLANA